MPNSRGRRNERDGHDDATSPHQEVFLGGLINRQNWSVTL